MPSPKAAGVEGVPGLIIVPIPTPEGELTALVETFVHQLGASSGERLHWRGVGDPRIHDKTYAQQRTQELERADQRQVAEFLRRLGDQRQMNHVRREYAELMECLGLPLSYLPALLFVAEEPVLAVASMRLDVRMFGDLVKRNQLARLLLEHLSEKKILDFAEDGRFTLASMRRLQHYLGTLDRKGQSACPEVTGTALSCEEGIEASGAYALAYRHGGECAPLSRAKYQELLKQIDQYDFLIDGTTRKCFKRPPSARKHLEAKLTPSELRLILSFVAEPGFREPTRWTGGQWVTDDAARRAFQLARQKADIKADGDGTLFSKNRGAPGEPTLFAFAPPEGVVCIVITPRPA